MFRSFGGSFAFTIVCLGVAFWLGYRDGGAFTAGLATMFTAGMLGILEVSLSFDNAVVNAKVLAGMNHFWRKMFLTVGVLIAVFGMRVVFPLIIVWAVGDAGASEVIRMTWENPARFQEILVKQHVVVAGFGGAFLWMVFTRFFFDHEKETHWLGFLEKPLSKAGKMEAVWVTFTMIISFAFSRLIPDGEGMAFLSASMLGILVFLMVEGLSSLLGNEEEGDTTGTVVRTAGTAGFASFMYLEVLDASFSFDGVIGAFAITNNLFIIALGLGIGAMFVRSLTIKLVEVGTLQTYTYLEHGAFWAIGALSLIMYLSAAGNHIPEVVSGTVGLALIAASFVSSVMLNRRSTQS
ncbi:MAG: DUF475 domain-containing protein [Fibrobacterota bacterium]|nr:DUF475 domain-containing protein [Fibrobacterota bacterium]QQS07763.1 MAG: DUF475 domain-containing protein [Fibrobacterota bacterium]